MLCNISIDLGHRLCYYTVIRNMRRLKDTILLILSGGLRFSPHYYSYDVVYQRASRFSPSSIRVTINRLVVSREVEKIEKNGVTHFQLTSRAAKQLREDLFLDYTPSRWDRKWRVAVAGKRNNLRKLGFGMLQRSIYISPFTVKTNASQLQFEVRQLLPFSNRELVRIAWKLDKLLPRYNKWIKKAANFDKKTGDITALVDEYRAIVRDDPKLPIELMPVVWPFLRAQKILLAIVGRNFP